MNKKIVIQIAKILLIIAILYTSLASIILIGFNWYDYFHPENTIPGDDSAMVGALFGLGIIYFIVDLICIGIFFILYKKTKKK